ncbi:MAG: prephenate/arogenate dehydrogenase [Elainellaceae cyanobacterium]
MKIGIVGLGLIGGSLAIDWRSLGHTILGVSRRPSTCEAAIARGIVDQASCDLALMAEAEVVVLCTPLGAFLPTVDQLLPHLSPETIVTDVGSVKGWVVEAIAPRWENFVGGHPMAGTAESGLDAALTGLFQNCIYAITPTAQTPIRAVEVVTQLARSLQAQVYQCDPQDHDRAVAWISHLPVMVSASLIASCMDEESATVRSLAQTLASSGFRDTSRVGGGNPELGVMMARYNQAAVVRSLQGYRQQLDAILQTIETSDWDSLETLLGQTQRDRPAFVDPV